MHVLHGAIDVHAVDTQPVPLRQPHTPLQVLDPFLLVPCLTFGRHVGHFQFLGNRFRVSAYDLTCRPGYDLTCR